MDQGTGVDWIGPNESKWTECPNGPKWIEMEQVNWSGPNGLKWTEIERLEWSRPNRPKWTE